MGHLQEEDPRATQRSWRLYYLMRLMRIMVDVLRLGERAHGGYRERQASRAPGRTLGLTAHDKSRSDLYMVRAERG